MKSIIRPVLMIIIVSLIIFLSNSLSGFKSVRANNISDLTNDTAAALVIQATATPAVEEDRSEIGSTDWITLMSFVIVSIVIIPIFLKRKSWSQE